MAETKRVGGEKRDRCKAEECNHYHPHHRVVDCKTGVCWVLSTIRPSDLAACVADAERKS